MGNILKIYHLKNEALIDLYKRLDKDLRPLPKKPDGSINPYGPGLEDNDIDALRHAYISGVYSIEYNEGTSELMGRLNELASFDSRSTSDLSENMDFCPMGAKQTIPSVDYTVRRRRVGMIFIQNL
jgi:hypothetical protein